MNRARRLPGPRFFRLWFTGAAGGTAASALSTLATGGTWLPSVPYGASGLLALALWWLSRRKGKRKALRALGSKARARLAVMARNMPQPGPVLRPVPQGARA